MKTCGIQHRRKPWFLVLATLAAALSGCVTYQEDPEGPSPEVYAQQRIRSVEERVTALEDRLRGLEAAQAAVARTPLPDESPAWRQQEAQARSAEIARLESRLQALEAARERDKREIVDQLGKRVDRALRPGASSSGSSQETETGYEHTVQQGETISAIAQAYGVRITDILKANKLKPNDTIRIGQKLFIPKR